MDHTLLLSQHVEARVTVFLSTVSKLSHFSEVVLCLVTPLQVIVKAFCLLFGIVSSSKTLRMTMLYTYRKEKQLPMTEYKGHSGSEL